MYAHGFYGPGPFLGIALHGLFALAVLAFFLGLLFLIILVIKTFNETRLRDWGFGLMIGGLIIGALIVLLTALHGPGMRGRGGMMWGRDEGMMREKMMNEYDEYDNGYQNDYSEPGEDGLDQASSSSASR